ncbi:Tripartite-type tricarboxylate transporter, receptor component TctC [Variovorax sp. HW608]|uniref:Bug family tripartite tricarboxylate transporter substrate binding protein n=1 Tax=Variovorax sp. HW608 TaxID=1034889 RepID=UPI00081F9535|nr:tripartite tricarboxylate transporter substrate binding protein [Variovorax sp. HW608]SCK42945.1 Tripartite-type tricarboxylate transporter, receptor component TctC [Variovorax sp. HW608]
MKAFRILAVAAAMTISVAAYADTWPSRPIKIIAPAPPGGPYDYVARALAEGLQRALGQPFVVENRAGAGGAIGMEAASKSAPDGYTLVVGSTGPMSVAPGMFKKLRYDPDKDFAPVARLVKMPGYLVVHPSLGVDSMKEFLTKVRADPGKYSYASTGNGFSQHTNMELLKSMANLFVVPITYRGSGPAMTDLIGGQVQMMIELGPVVIPHVKAGRLKVLAASTGTRTEAMPEVPTLNESGVKGFDAYTWFALYAPAGTPSDIVQKLYAETARVLSQPELKSRLASQGAEVALTTPSELATFQAAETKKWTSVVQRAGILPE